MDGFMFPFYIIPIIALAGGIYLVEDKTVSCFIKFFEH